MFWKIVRLMLGRCGTCGGRWRPMNPYALDVKFGEGWTYPLARQCVDCGWQQIHAVKTVSE